MMKRLLIMGAGGHGKVAAAIAEDMGKWETIAFLDDRYEELKSATGLNLLGTFDFVENSSRENDEWFVALGDNEQRVEWLQRLRDQGKLVPCLTHSTAWVANSATLGPGTLIGPQAVVHVDVRIETGCIINTAATVDHDGVLEEGVHISPGVHLAGEVQVGAFTTIGIGASVSNQIRIGHHVILGAGSVVVDSLPDNVTAAGIPAKIKKTS